MPKVTNGATEKVAPAPQESTPEPSPAIASITPVVTTELPFKVTPVETKPIEVVNSNESAIAGVEEVKKQPLEEVKVMAEVVVGNEIVTTNEDGSTYPTGYYRNVNIPVCGKCGSKRLSVDERHYACSLDHGKTYKIGDKCPKELGK